MSSSRTMKQPPGGDCHDLFGAEFKGSPCHHRVLKPPGGGTSDIFGAAEGVEQSPRRARNTHHLQSSVFGANGASEAPSTPRTKPGNDSHNRLFGPTESRPQTTVRNRLKSSIPLGGAEENHQSSPAENGQQEVLSTPKARRNPVTGDGVCSSDSILRRSTKKRDGNPVTGEGYSAVNGEKESSPANGTSSAEARRNRVPPGGYSSGLW
ncbi:microtubule-associated protein Jupiter isoform X2 [Periplaneta americana]|uniref:microtubule-associated protein Jupiter isoform X2 n=1 Tax=Periplaneta americana TaxID=6978 RepID=UPI0037E73E4A